MYDVIRRRDGKQKLDPSGKSMHRGENTFLKQSEPHDGPRLSVAPRKALLRRAGTHIDVTAILA